jgi:hypothetical protein
MAPRASFVVVFVVVVRVSPSTIYVCSFVRSFVRSVDGSAACDAAVLDVAPGSRRTPSPCLSLRPKIRISELRNKSICRPAKGGATTVLPSATSLAVRGVGRYALAQVRATTRATMIDRRMITRALSGSPPGRSVLTACNFCSRSRARPLPRRCSMRSSLA